MIEQARWTRLNGACPGVPHQSGYAPACAEQDVPIHGGEMLRAHLTEGTIAATNNAATARAINVPNAQPNDQVSRRQPDLHLGAHCEAQQKVESRRVGNPRS